MENSLLAFSGHRSVHIVHFFAHLQKHLFTCGECRLIGMLLEYEQVAAHLDTACLHEKSVRQTYCADKVGMVHPDTHVQNLFPAVSATPLEVTKASRPPSESSSIALDKKVVVNGLCGLFVDTALFPQVGIEDTEVAERNV